MGQTVRDICTDMGQKMLNSMTDDWINGEFPTQDLLIEMMLWWIARIEDVLTRTFGKNKKAMSERDT